MTPQPRLPFAARWLLWLSPVPRDSRAEVQADLQELFIQRRTERGNVHAHWRLYHDVASLWLHRRPVVRMAAPRSPFSVVADMRGDLRYAVRLFARQPATLLLTIVGLSLGLAIATAAFSIMNGAVLRGEGVVEPDRAPGILRTTDRSVSTAWSYAEFLQLREGATRMQLEAVFNEGANVRTTPTDAEGSATELAFVSDGFFEATGGRTIAGRPLNPSDEQQSGPPPVVVSFVFWTTRLNRDPAAVGRTIWIGRTAATIVGIAERRFTVPNNRLLWMPLTGYELVYSAAPKRTAPNVLVEVFGRLRPTVTFAEAEAQLSGVASGLKAESPLRVKLDAAVGLGRQSASTTRAITNFVIAVIGLILLMACVNVAAVLISTAITREREMGVRAALGASRWRIVRQLVTESLALGVIAATVGAVMTYLAVPTVGAMLEAPPGADFAPDFNVYAFLALATLIIGVGAGVAPARHSRGADLLTPLKGDGSRPDRVSPRRLRTLLVVTQAAASVLLIVLAALFVRASIRAATVDVGFNADGLYGISVSVSDAGRDGAGTRSFWARAIPEVQAVAGVQSVSLAEITPFGYGFKTALTRDQPSRMVHLNRTRPEYFEALGLHLVEGRHYTPGEIAAKAPVAVVSESLARAYWPGRSPIGQLLPEEIPLPPTVTMVRGKLSAGPAPRPTVIGVVTDAIPARLHERSPLALYEPLDPASEVFARLVIRVAPGTAGVIQQVKQRLRALDPQANITIMDVAARLRQEASQPRMLAILTGTIGLIAIVLSAIGLYGLTASVVGQRSREMGVRVAMGAEPRDLLRLLMWDSLRPVVLGLAVGLGSALLASRAVMAIMFFGVSPKDPIAFAGAAFVVVTTAGLAVLVPTRRAASVDAAFVLRQS